MTTEKSDSQAEATQAEVTTRIVDDRIWSAVRTIVTVAMLPAVGILIMNMSDVREALTELSVTQKYIEGRIESLSQEALNSNRRYYRSEGELLESRVAELESEIATIRKKE